MASGGSLGGVGEGPRRWHWAVHGIVLGLIAGIPDFHFRYMILGDLNSGIYLLFGPIWGLKIDLFTSVVFKARQVQV